MDDKDDDRHQDQYQDDQHQDDDQHQSVEDVVQRMDAGDFDGTFAEALKSLSKDELEQLANVMIQRDVDKRQE